MIALRPVLAQDAEALFALAFNSPVTDTLVWDGPESLESFRQSLAEREQMVRQGRLHSFTVLEPGSELPIGSASIRPDGEFFHATIGLWIGQPYQGKGYGRATVRWLVVYGFEKLGLEKIDAYVFSGNWASRRIHETNGFQLEGTLRKALRKRGQAIDDWVFGITREEYEQGSGDKRI